jgi:hypothetical protein
MGAPGSARQTLLKPPSRLPAPQRRIGRAAAASLSSPARSHQAANTLGSIGTRTTSRPLRRTARSIYSVATRRSRVWPAAYRQP